MQTTTVQRTTHKKNHSPTLATQLMVAQCLRQEGSFSSRRALMDALPRKVEYATLVKILEHLEALNMIFMSEDGSIVWVFSDNPKLLKLLEESAVLKCSATHVSASN
jgi:hypothetical protein